MFADFRFAARSLLKTPAFAFSVILILALGIGASTAIFTLVYGVVFLIAARGATRVDPIVMLRAE